MSIPDHPIVPAVGGAASVPARADVLGVPVFSDLTLPDGAGAEIDSVFLAQRRFEGRPGQAQAMLADDGTTVVALGVGEKGAVGKDDLRRAAAGLARHAGAARHVATTLTKAAGPSLNGPAASAVVEGFGLGSYRYAGAPARLSDAASARVERLTVVGADREALSRGQVTMEETCRARDWVNRPPRDLTPRELARLARSATRSTGLQVEVWDERRLAAERLGGLLGVAAGAAEPPRLIRLEHQAGRGGTGRRRAQAGGSARDRSRAGRSRGGRPSAGVPTIHLVGKGITFDSGGLSLKPPGSMMTMKDDMGGAAAVICATVALARLDVPVNVVGWVAATENMPSGTAIHPGDVLTARNGKTIEVLNTDAEGRLVLADALSLAAEERPDAIIDVATLTGGQRVALGDKVAAVMGTDPGLIKRIVDAGSAAGEPTWELPLYAPYRKQLDSEVADLKNVSAGPAASSIMAGLFLKEFVGDCSWAHLDIAAPAWAESDDAWISKGGTGWGTRTLIELVCAW